MDDRCISNTRTHIINLYRHDVIHIYLYYIMHIIRVYSPVHNLCWYFVCVLSLSLYPIKVYTLSRSVTRGVHIYVHYILCVCIQKQTTRRAVMAR